MPRPQFVYRFSLFLCLGGLLGADAPKSTFQVNEENFFYICNVEGPKGGEIEGWLGFSPNMTPADILAVVRLLESASLSRITLSDKFFDRQCPNSYQENLPLEELAHDPEFSWLKKFKVTKLEDLEDILRVYVKREESGGPVVVCFSRASDDDPFVCGVSVRIPPPSVSFSKGVLFLIPCIASFVVMDAPSGSRQPKKKGSARPKSV